MSQFNIIKFTSTHITAYFKLIKYSVHENGKILLQFFPTENDKNEP